MQLYVDVYSCETNIELNHTRAERVITRPLHTYIQVIDGAGSRPSCLNSTTCPLHNHRLRCASKKDKEAGIQTRELEKDVALSQLEREEMAYEDDVSDDVSLFTK